MSIETTIRYRFRNPALLTQALTHRSMPNMPCNEQLEFLGDSILGAVVASHVWFGYAKLPEGVLVARKRELVNNDYLAQVAIRLGIPQDLQVSRSCHGFTAQAWQKAYADALEAIIGAIYVDGGMENAASFIHRHIIRSTE